MQHPQKAAAETEAQTIRHLRLIGETAVVELQAGQGFAQVLEIVVVDRIESRKDHRFRLFVAGERLRSRTQGVRHGVADVDIFQGFDVRREVSDLASAQFFAPGHPRPETPHFRDDKLPTRPHEAHFLSHTHLPVHDPHIHHNSLVGIKMRIVHQSPQGLLHTSLGRRNPFDDSGHQVVHA